MLLLCVLWSCGSSSGTPSTPGPLVDNTKWMPSEEGEEFFGAPPADSVCLPEPIDCPEYRWRDGECVDLAGSTCIVSFVPECFGAFTVLAVYTRMANPQLPLCNWLTLEQPSLRAIQAGDQVEVRTRHAALTAPATDPATRARMSFVIGDQIAFDYNTLIPSASKFSTNVWTASKDYPAGTPLLFHVENHGSNEYMLIEVNILDPH